VSETIIADTGPLVALLARRDRYHRWVREVMATFQPPLLTCEAVLSESAYLLRRQGYESDPLFGLIERGVLKIAFSLADEVPAVRQLMHRYRDQPMSVADASLVRLCELHNPARILTFDSDFRVYRRLGRLLIPTHMPDPHDS
jgi:predicted nucleic acid-binding protein